MSLLSRWFAPPESPGPPCSRTQVVALRDALTDWIDHTPEARP